MSMCRTEEDTGTLALYASQMACEERLGCLHLKLSFCHMRTGCRYIYLDVTVVGHLLYEESCSAILLAELIITKSIQNTICNQTRYSQYQAVSEKFHIVELSFHMLASSLIL